MLNYGVPLLVNRAQDVTLKEDFCILPIHPAVGENDLPPETWISQERLFLPQYFRGRVGILWPDHACTRLIDRLWRRRFPQWVLPLVQLWSVIL